MGFLVALIVSFVPAFACALLVYWLDRYEKEPRLLLGAVFFWGAVVAVVGALVAQLILAGAVTAATGSEKAADVAGSTLFAPITEESLKGIAILAVFLVLRREFDSVLDGIVYAAVVALGFAATENVFYLYGEFTEKGMNGLFSLFIVRVVLGIWNHPFYTSWIGIGLALSRLSPKAFVRWFAPPLGWAAALGFHSLHNTLATFAEGAPGLGVLMFLVDWLGWLAISILILVSIRREGRLLGTHLAEEVGLGRLTAAQYKTATSSWAQSGARLRTLFGAGRRPTRRFYQVCGELAHKKAQLARLGDEGRNLALVEKLRAELAGLSSRAIC
ncbi:MAG TPA: PrsW family intramembrane metalloprotease [Thermoanaerobaculia bacterium]|jgi:RsiW-degrading membrane proteinase PrsW (M82 family)|nr:PrsW family intramembrane metalloprotease [Thermoanaerobaculia bacterium]